MITPTSTGQEFGRGQNGNQVYLIEMCDSDIRKRETQ